MNIIRTGWLLCLSTALASCFVYLQLPEAMELPTSWNLNGQPDQFSPAWKALLLSPLLMFVTLGLFSVFKFLEPRRVNVEQSERASSWIVFSVVIMLLMLEATAIAAAYDIDVPTLRIVFFGVGIVLTVAGNFLSKIRSNYSLGIRTPWTLSDDEIWRKTNRIAGMMFFVTGLGISFGALFIRESLLVQMLIVGVIPSAISPVIYSYWLWRNGCREIKI